MSKLNREERLESIRNIVTERHAISTSELQEIVDVSRMTLFRDLEILEEEGFIERLYGSVTLARKPYDIDESSSTFIEEKRQIAQETLKYIHEGDALFLGAGTTTLEIARAIAAVDLKVIVLTNSLPVAHEIQSTSNVRLFVTGGDYHPVTRSLCGPITLRTLDGLSAQTLFLGANAVDFEVGFSGDFAEQAEILQSMIEKSQQTIAVIDSSKFGKVSVHRICRINQVDMIITDNKLAPNFCQRLDMANIRYRLA